MSGSNEHHQGMNPSMNSGANEIPLAANVILPEAANQQMNQNMLRHVMHQSNNQSNNQSESPNSQLSYQILSQSPSQMMEQPASTNPPYTGRCAVLGCDRLPTHISFRHKGVYHGARIPEVSRLPIVLDDNHRRICFQCLDLHRRQSGRTSRENGLIVCYFNLPHRYHSTPRSKSMYEYEGYQPHPCIVSTINQSINQVNNQPTDGTLNGYMIACSPESGFCLIDPNREHREQIRMKRENNQSINQSINQYNQSINLSKPSKHRVSTSHDDDYDSDDSLPRKRAKINHSNYSSINQPINQSINQSMASSINQSFLYTVNHRYTLQLGARPQTVITDVLAQCSDLNRANLIALSSMSNFDVGSLTISVENSLVSISVQSARDYRSYEVYVERQAIDRETALQADVDKFITQLRSAQSQ